MVFKIALNRCCCDQALCDALKNVCRMTVSFENSTEGTGILAVDEATVTGVQDNAIPFIHATANPFTELGQCVPGLGKRATCVGWNRNEGQQEWELFPVDGSFPSLELELFIDLAAGEAGAGFSIEPEVYELPTIGDPNVHAGSYCFPCADFGDNAGLTLRLTCDAITGNFGAALTLYTPGKSRTDICSIATWQWDPFVPDPFGVGLNGSGNKADSLGSIGYINGALPGAGGDPCYTPAGRCRDSGSIFPFCRDEAGDTSPSINLENTTGIYDTYNCFWDTTPESFPVLRFYECERAPPDQVNQKCDTCPTSNIQIPHTDFGGVGGGDEDQFVNQGDVYVDENFWLLTENNGQPGVVDTFGTSDIELDFPCHYEVYLRYHTRDPDAFPGELRIFNITGAGGAFVGVVDFTFELSQTTDIDGAHNTDIINGFRYQKMVITDAARVQDEGKTAFQMHDVNDEFVRIEIEGPVKDAAALEFDDIILRRL